MPVDATANQSLLGAALTATRTLPVGKLGDGEMLAHQSGRFSVPRSTLFPGFRRQIPASQGRSPV